MSSNQQYQPPDLQRLSVNAADFDWQIYTDGSGHVDQFGGAGVIGFSPRFHKYFTRAAAFYGYETDRAEMEAMLLGLHTIMVKMGVKDHADFKRLELEPITVFWMTDREDLAGSASGMTFTERPPYKRRANMDLWLRMEWYERYMRIIAVHRKRNTNPYQKLADRLASDCRPLIKGFIETLRAEKCGIE